MRITGTSRAFVSSQSLRGEMARSRAASAGRRRRGSGRGSDGRGVRCLVSMVLLPRSVAGGCSKQGHAVTSNVVRSDAANRSWPVPALRRCLRPHVWEDQGAENPGLQTVDRCCAGREVARERAHLRRHRRAARLSTELDSPSVAREGGAPEEALLTSRRQVGPTSLLRLEENRPRRLLPSSTT